MASLLDILNLNGGPGGLLGGLQAEPETGTGFAGGLPGGLAGGLPNGLPGDLAGAAASFAASNPLTLLALGAGIAKGGVAGMGAALPAAQLDQKERKQEAAQAATYAALRAAGMPHGVAAASALRPELLKAIAPEYFSGFKVVQTGQGRGGNKIFKLQGPGGQLFDIPPAGAAADAMPGATAVGAGLKGTPKNAGAFFGDPGLAPATTDDLASQTGAPEAETNPAAGPPSGMQIHKSLAGAAPDGNAKPAAVAAGLKPALTEPPLPDAIEMLNDPARAEEVDARYGRGTAARIRAILMR
jgi:hypothetical protein